MKEVDWSSDLLLSCCCLLLPVMSSNGIQLTIGEGKYVHGRGGWGCNGPLCKLCTPVLTQDIDHFLSKTACVSVGCLCLNIPHVHNLISTHVEFEREQCQIPEDSILSSANMWFWEGCLERGQGKEEEKHKDNQEQHLFFTSWSKKDIQKNHKIRRVILLALKATKFPLPNSLSSLQMRGRHQI